jgi:hypothetical protein
MSQFDVFQQEAAGSVVWRGTAASLEEANRLVLTLGAKAPATYLVVNLTQGTRIAVESDGQNLRPSAA